MINLKTRRLDFIRRQGCGLESVIRYNKMRFAFYNHCPQGVVQAGLQVELEKMKGAESHKMWQRIFIGENRESRSERIQISEDTEFTGFYSNLNKQREQVELRSHEISNILILIRINSGKITLLNWFSEVVSSFLKVTEILDASASTQSYTDSSDFLRNQRLHYLTQVVGENRD